MKTITVLGYKQSRCRACTKQYNERSGNALNFIEYPTEVVMMAVHYYYRFKVSFELPQLLTKEGTENPDVIFANIKVAYWK